MKEKNDQQLQMRVSAEFLRDLDEWRRKQDEIPSRAEAIRRLVGKGIRENSNRPINRGE